MKSSIDRPASQDSRRAYSFEGAHPRREHLHFPGFGRMAERAGRYILVPEPWALEL
jgi:hypothetical protein